MEHVFLQLLQDEYVAGVSLSVPSYPRFGLERWGLSRSSQEDDGASAPVQ